MHQSSDGTSHLRSMSFRYVIGCKLQKFGWRSFAGENGGVRKNTFQLSATATDAHTESQRFAARMEDFEEKKGLGPKPRPFHQQTICSPHAAASSSTPARLLRQPW